MTEGCLHRCLDLGDRGPLSAARLGSTRHNFAIVAEFEGGYADALWEARIPGLDVGETGAVTFTPDTAGTYFYVCTVAAHRFQGMAGGFVVEG
ncbi:MAG: cupredoxin domain-containing protein [Acidimicrobiia bacterium]